MIKLSSIPCKMQVFSDDSDESNLLKVRLKLNKTGANYKKIKFSESSIKNAEKSLQNIPILGFLKKTNDEGTEYDYDGHNVVANIVKKDNRYDMEYTFLERPIGVIPETANISYQEENGDIYVYCDGYIWKSYANQGLDVIMDADYKGISMEIRIFDGYLDDEGFYNVESFEYRGVTVLGDDVLPAIEGACLVKYDNFSTYKKDIEKIVKEIYSMKGDDNVSDENKPVEKPTEEPESIEKPAEEPVKEPESAEEPTEDKVEPVKEPESAEKPAEEPVEKKLDFSMFNELLGVDEAPATCEELFNAVKEKFSVMSENLKELQDFKNSVNKKELEEKVNAITNKFSFEDEEISDLKDKVLNNEINTEQYENELFCLYGKKMLSEKTNKKFSKPTTENKKLSLDINDNNTINDVDEPVYSDLIKKCKNEI